MHSMGISASQNALIALHTLRVHKLSNSNSQAAHEARFKKCGAQTLRSARNNKFFLFLAEKSEQALVDECVQ